MARTEIAVSVVERLVAAQFPDYVGLPIRPVIPGGWDNRTFRLGDELVVRMPSAERYAGAVAKEQKWLPVLARALPVAVPQPVGLGRPEFGYPWAWSILRWIDGDQASDTNADSGAFAGQLAAVLTALHRVDASNGPVAGAENFHRGDDLATYDPQVRAALARFDEAARAATVWEAALSSKWSRLGLWVHGDIAPGNMLVANGRLAAVIDWGNCAVGDPACDLAIAWTFFRGDARRAFRNALSLDDATWDRARGWALWKALILATGRAEGGATDVADAPRVLRELLG